MRDVVEKKQTIGVERSGKPHVVIISVDEHERLMAAQEEQEDWHELVRQAREQVRADPGGRDVTPPEDVLQQIREERDEQLATLR